MSMSRIATEYKVNGQVISYEVVDNGYNIYLGETLWITQPEPYIPNRSLSYEENAIAQIGDIAKGFEEVSKKENSVEEEIIEE